jgi:hypothetical protein
MTFTCVDPSGKVELVSYPDGRSYWCEVSFDNPNDAFNCKTGVSPGLKQAVTSGGLTSCACGTLGAIGFPNCTYDCVLPN